MRHLTRRKPALHCTRPARMLMRKPAANCWRRSASNGASEEIAMKPIFAALFAALLLTAGVACAQPSIKQDEGSAEEAETSPSLERDHGAAANAPHQIVVCRRCRQLALGGLRNRSTEGRF